LLGGAAVVGTFATAKPVASSARNGFDAIPNPTREQRNLPRFEDGPDFVGVRAAPKPKPAYVPRQADENEIRGMMQKHVHEHARFLNAHCPRAHWPRTTIVQSCCEMNHHLAANSQFPDLTEDIRDSARFMTFVMPALLALSAGFNLAAERHEQIRIAFLPLAPRGLGVFQVESSPHDGPILLRQTLSYAPNQMKLVFTSDINFSAEL